MLWVHVAQLYEWREAVFVFVPQIFPSICANHLLHTLFVGHWLPCPLSSGVDASVKVVYKPVRRFREEGGLLSKNVTYTYKQVTEILNSRSEPAVITFVDQVPKSQDEKLKVRFMIRVGGFQGHVA